MFNLAHKFGLVLVISFPFSMQVKVGEKTEKVGFFHCYKRGVDRVFVDHPSFLEKVGLSVNHSSLQKQLIWCKERDNSRLISHMMK